MPNIFSILTMLGILSILILVHEAGHFAVARFFGFQTPVFGFGLPFGPSWTIGEKWGTQFKIHLLMLGGYVAIPELGDESALAHEAYGVPLKPFTKFPIWQRALVAFAGVAMNMIFAYFVMVAMVWQLGLPSDKVYVKELVPQIPIAREAGVQANDHLDTIDGVKVTTIEQVISYFGKHKQQTVTLGILREPEELRGTADGEAKATKVEIKAAPNADGKLGMGLVTPRIKTANLSPVDVCSHAFSELADLTNQMVQTLCKMFYQILFGWAEHHPKGEAPKAGIGDLHGVLVVIKWGAELAQEDWTSLFTFTALISMDLAIVNLLPIPALDGGHLFFMLIEAIRGRPMDEKIHGEMVKWGFISLLALMALIMVNDIRALVTGELDYKKKKQIQEQKKPDASIESKPSDEKVETEGNSSEGAAGANKSSATNESAPALDEAVDKTEAVPAGK